MKPVIFWLAFRNLTGNMRRTGLTVAAIAAGLGALIFLWAFNDGLHRNMLGNFQDSIIGSLQIHRSGFFENPELVRHIQDQDAVIRALDKAGVEHWTRRLEAFALAASDSGTEGTFLIGIDPRHERNVTRLHEKVTAGRFIQPDDEYTCVLGTTAARNLGVTVGEEVVLVAYDRFGVISAESFQLVGIITSGELGIDRGLLVAPLVSLQEMLEMPGLITDFPVRVAEHRLDEVTRRLQLELESQDLEILRWHDMFPVMLEWVTLHDGFLYLFLGIVMLIVLAGVLNTILLSMMDRIREFGIFMALGNRNREIGMLVMAESLLIGLAGVGIGLVFGLFLVAVGWYSGIDLSAIVGDTQRFYVDPVIRPSLSLEHLTITAITMLGMTVLAGVYPAWRALRLTPAEAMRHV